MVDGKRERFWFENEPKTQKVHLETEKVLSQQIMKRHGDDLDDDDQQAASKQQKHDDEKSSSLSSSSSRNDDDALTEVFGGVAPAKPTLDRYEATGHLPLHVLIKTLMWAWQTLPAVLAPIIIEYIMPSIETDTKDEGWTDAKHAYRSFRFLDTNGYERRVHIHMTRLWGRFFNYHPNTEQTAAIEQRLDRINEVDPFFQRTTEAVIDSIRVRKVQQMQAPERYFADIYCTQTCMLCWTNRDVNILRLSASSTDHDILRRSKSLLRRMDPAATEPEIFHGYEEDCEVLSQYLCPLCTRYSTSPESRRFGHPPSVLQSRMFAWFKIEHEAVAWYNKLTRSPSQPMLL
jgi:hypothetical protein